MFYSCEEQGVSRHGVSKAGARPYSYTVIHTLLMLPEWAFQLNRIKKIQIYKLIENVNTIIL